MRRRSLIAALAALVAFPKSAMAFGGMLLGGASGGGVAPPTRTPFVILASGQSNMVINRAFAWSPSARVKLWNNSPGSDSSVGTAFNAISSAQINIALAYANLVAQADPNKDVYVINLSQGSMDIGHWTPGKIYTWEATIGGEPTTGHIRRNNPTGSITQFNVSNKDKFGNNAYYHPDSVTSGLKATLLNGASTNIYTGTGTPTLGATSVTVPVSHVSGVETFSGDIQWISQPNFYNAMQSVVPAALSALGISKIDMFMWWQGENDALQGGPMTQYKAEFEFFTGNLKSVTTWFKTTTKMLLMGTISDTLLGIPPGTAFDLLRTALGQLAAADPTNRKFSDTVATLNTAVWWGTGPSDNLHMTADGYKSAADLAFGVYAPPLV